MMTIPMTLLEDLKRQVKEELKDCEATRQQEIMLFQKYGIMQALLTAEEMVYVG